MFGQKQKKIEHLQSLIGVLTRDLTYERQAKKLAFDARDSEQAVTAKLRQQLSEYARQLTYEKELSGKIRAESEDLARQLELYKALLGQLQIVVKLPARKK